VRVHVGEERFGQPVPLQQVPKVDDRGLSGNTVIAQLDPAKRRMTSLSYSVSSAIGSLSAY